MLTIVPQIVQLVLAGPRVKPGSLVPMWVTLKQPQNICLDLISFQKSVLVNMTSLTDP